MKQLATIVLLMMSVTIAPLATHAEPASNDMLDVAMCIAVAGWVKEMARQSQVMAEKGIDIGGPTSDDMARSGGLASETQDKYIGLWFKRYPGIDPRPFITDYMDWIYVELDWENRTDTPSDKFIRASAIFIQMEYNCNNDWPGE